MAVLNRHSSYISFHISAFSFNINNLKHPFIRNPEPHIIPCKRHTIDPLLVIVILWAWVQFKHLAKSRKVLITETCAQLSRETHLNLLPTFFINKSATHAHMRIGILHIRFYIVYWSTVNKVGTCNNKRKRKPITPILYTQQAHR